MTAFSSSRSLRSHQPGVPRSSPGLALLLILALLLPAFHGPGQGQTSQSAPQRTLPDTPDAPPRAVPPTLAVRPEVIGLRTATSAVFDMGDNTYTLFQDSRPLHYQDEAGTWQAVNPAFAATQQGWNNLTNPLQTSLGLNTSAARISAANIGAAWRPLDLSLTAADGRRQTLATPLASWDAAAGVRSGDSRSVRYHASWSDADVQDQWQAGRGSSEYAMRLQSRPEVAGLAPEHLDLRVLLTLLPGTTVQVNGQPASLPLETAEALEFVGPDGVAMRLMPPRTLEQKNAAESVAGSYLLRSGGSATELELLVRTPWSWLNAQERQYPVIIDPLFQIRSPFEYKIARYPWNGVSEQSTAGPFENYVTMDRLAAGQFNEGALRLLLHYDMPTMPIGTRVQEAYLSATPSGAFNDRANQVTAMDAYVFDDWSHPPLEVATPGMPAPQAGPYETRMAYSETFAGAGQHISHVWDISSAAETWLQRTITQGAEAGGIIIRARDERRCFYLTGVIVHERQHCGGFYFASPSTWTEDDLFLTEVISDPGAAPADAPEGTGIRLEVRYQGPTLTKGQTIDMRPSFGVAGGSPSADPNYYHADHEYRVANANLRDNRWSALVARGFAATTANPLPAPDQVRFATPLNGALALSVRTGDDQQQRASSSADSGQVGYVLFDGRDGGGLDAAPRVRVRATTNATPANAYDVRLIGQTGALTGTIPGTIAGGTMQELNYTFASDQPLGLWNLRLPASSNSRVDIAVPADSLESSAYYHNARFFNAELYDSSAGTYLTPQSGHIRVASNVEPNSSPWSIAEGSVFLTSGIFPVAAAGDYGLALRYNGPAVTVNDIPEPPAFGAPQAPNENKQLAFSIKVRITSCQTVDILGYPLFPTSAGTCEAIKCPSTATPFRTGDGLGMWSPAGWTAPAAPFDNVAGSVLFGANSSSSAPTVAVVGGTVHYDGAKVTISGPTNTQPASVLLLQCPALTGANQAPTGYFSVFDGKLASVNPLIGTSSLQPSPAGSGTSHYDPWLTTDKVDLQSQGSRIVPATGLALGNAQVTRRTGAESTDNLYFNANWGVDVGGMPSLEAHSSISKVGDESPPDIASLVLDMGTAFALQLSPAGGQNIARYIQGIRFGQTGQATVTQPQGLGGASKPIQGIISPRGAAPPGAPQLIASAGSMIDLRNPNDASGNDRTWAMPDVHTELAPGLIALKQNGALQVYSKDHPLAHQAFAQDLHYDGFNASVSVDIARCDPDDAADALVIRGEMSMTLPNLGDSTDPDGVIAASFKLCDTSLRSVHLQFNSPIGLPIGSTGLFMTSLEGGVDIYANHTTIQFDIALQAAPGSDGGGLKIQGGVFIDTLGMFEFQGSGSLLSGALSVDGSLWVGWNPLDVGFSVEIKYLGWLKGFANAHMWKGQGFNHRYAWLPDDDETHITGEIGAELKIKQGAIFTTELLDMPPGDVVITLKLAFGQFCTSADCTKFEWGIKGTFEILDYPIGVYYTFGRDLDHPEISLSNISFIIGNDGYTLIDRYGGAQPWPTLRGTPASPATDGARLIAYGATGTITATETFTVTEQTEQVLAGLGWRAGAPNLSLIAPDGTRLEGADATAYTTVISNTGQQILLSMQHPDDDQLAWAGTWQAEISNLGDEPFVENYQFVAFMNSGAPGTASDYRFLSAGARMTANANAYTIAWAVPANAAQAAPHSTISLFYTRVDDPAAASGNLGARVPIRSNLPLTAGSYNWNMQGLPSGTYQISAVVDDGVNESPFGAGGSPDVCTPLTSGLPPARAFSPERFPGTVAFSSTETIELIDPNPPPTPTGLSLDSLDGALIARWDGPAAADWDTQGYVVAWTQTTPRGAINNEQYVSASSSPAVRIGGVDNSLPVAVQVRAVDASHNLSAAALANGTPSGNSDPLPLQPQNLLTTAVSSTQATFTWQANPAGPTPSSYRVLAVNVVTGAISETTVPGPTATLSALQPGAVYDVRVSANNSAGWHSLSTEPVRVLATNGADANGDGLPDDWQSAYRVSGGAADPDRDGLGNAAEYTAQTSPIAADTDGDGFSDFEEIHQTNPAFNTDPLASTAAPPERLQPRLVVSEDTLNFKALYGPSMPIADQAIRWSNISSGTLGLRATPEAPWITTEVTADQIVVGVDASKLSRGFYSGILRLAPTPGSDPLIEGPSCVRVNLWVATPPGGYRVYVPLLPVR